MASRMTIMAALVLALAGEAPGGLDMRYADGLAAIGYYDYAIEHLNAMRTMPGVPAEDLLQIPLKLGTIYHAQSLREGNSETRERLLGDASKLLDEFATKNPTSPLIVDVSLTRVDIECSRAQTVESRLAAEKDPKQKDELLKQAEDMYKKALGSAQTIADEAAKRVKDLRPRMLMSKQAEADFWVQYGAQVRGAFLLGHVEYLWAQPYPPANAERKKHLDNALKNYDEMIKLRPQTNVTFEAYVRKGMVLRELAPLEKKPEDRDAKLKQAMGAFESARSAEVGDQTRATRAEANYQKALTAVEMGDWEAAASAADAFLREYAGGKDSYHGQEGLLLKARSLGKQAEGIFNKKEPGWEDFYAEATRTVKDILPAFAKIREAADKLVQDWNKVLPSRVAVISPLSAVAEAKKFYADGKLDEAVAKYQEAITLSGTSEDYADFAQEAWKYVGKIYYDTKRYYMAAIAWEELIKRFPNTLQGADIAWLRSQIFRRQYTAGGAAGDLFDLNEYLGALRFFIEKFPKDDRVFEAQTECAKVYAIRGETVASADLWATTDPANARYAECMSMAGELYRQAFQALVDKKEGQSDDAKTYLAATIKHLRLAADAPLSADAKENYNLRALARLIQVLVNPAAPQPESSEKVPALVVEFRTRFKDDATAMPEVLLAGVQAFVNLSKPDDAEPLALALEKSFAASYACSSAVNLMVVSYQKVNPAKANEWQKKTFSGDYKTASDASLETLGNRAWKDKNFTDAIACFDELTKDGRVRKRNDPAKTQEFRESLAAVYFESRHWKEAIPLYEVFLGEARRALKDPKAFDSRVLLLMRRLAECDEMGGQPAKAVPLWNDYSRVVFRPEGAPDWFEARYHLANAWANQNKFNEANDVLFRVEAGYGSVGKDPAVLQAVEALKKRIDYETYRKTRIKK